MGRPRKQFTEEQISRIDKLAEAQCRDNHIALVVGIDAETFKHHFKGRCAEKRAEGKARVLEAQYRAAQAPGNTVASIWWGKQHLEQTDRQDHNIRGEVKLLPPAIK